MKLSAGERYPLTDEKMYIVLTSGEAEVYAVTKQQDSFRQMFLTELSPGEAAFPSMDEFGMVDVVVYAVEDAELDLLPLAGGAMRYRHLIQFNNKTVEWFKRVYKDELDVKKFNRYVNEHF